MLVVTLSLKDASVSVLVNLTVNMWRIIWNWQIKILWWPWVIHHRWLTKSICLKWFLSRHTWPRLLIYHIRNLLLACATHTKILCFDRLHWYRTLWSSSPLNRINLWIQSTKTTVRRINFMLSISLIKWIRIIIRWSFNLSCWTIWCKAQIH